MTIGEGIFLSLFFLGFFACSIVVVIKETKFQKELRDFRNSVKDSLKGIYEELKLSNFLKFDFSEVHKNEN